MRIVVRTEHQLRPHEPVQERPERLRPVEVDKSGSFFSHGIITDAPTFLVAGDVVSIEIRFHAMGLGNEHFGDEVPRQKLFEVMRSEFRYAHPSDSAEDVAKLIAEYNLLALPVIDDEGDIAGIVTVDDAMEILLPKNIQRRLPRLFG